MYRLAQFFGPFAKRCLLVTLVAIAANASAQDRSGELQLIVNRLNQQLELVARFDVRRSQSRYDALAEAIELWDASPRGNAEFAVMESWLNEALRASMPGSKATMPAAPDFKASSFNGPNFEVVGVEALPSPVVVAPKPVPVVPEIAPSETTASGEASPMQTSQPSDSVPAVDLEISIASEPAKSPLPPASSSPWDNHPATRPIRIESPDPFVDDPIAQPSPTTITAKTSAEDKKPRVAMRPTTFVSRESQPEVNIAELAARTNGYERGLQQIEAKLIAAGNLDSADLLMLAREVSELAKQHEFIALYTGSLSDAQRELLVPPPTVDAVKARLAKKIGSLKQQGSAPDDVFLPARDEALEAATELLECL